MSEDKNRRPPEHDRNQPGDAGDDRAPGEYGRGDLSETDRQGSHGQAATPHELAHPGIASKGGGVLSSQGLVDLEDTEDVVTQTGVHRVEHVEKRSGSKH